MWSLHQSMARRVVLLALPLGVFSGDRVGASAHLDEDIARLSSFSQSLMAAGWTPDMQVTISSVINQIRDTMGKIIEQDFGTTKVGLETMLADYHSALNHTRTMYRAANSSDWKWVDCVGEEKVQSFDYEVQVNISEVKAGKCEDAESIKVIHVETGTFTISCNLLEESAESCLAKMHNVTAQVNGWRSKVDEDKAAYEKAVQACVDAGPEDDTHVTEVEEPYFAQRQECKALSHTRLTKHCGFEHAWHNLCDSKFKDLKERVKQVQEIGNLYSEPDRKRQWNVLQETKCVLEDLFDKIQEEHGFTYDPNEIEACRGDVNYTRDIGNMSALIHEVEHLIDLDELGEPDFPCSMDVDYSFSGFTWSGVGQEDPRSEDYNKTAIPAHTFTHSMHKWPELCDVYHQCHEHFDNNTLGDFESLATMASNWDNVTLQQDAFMPAGNDSLIGICDVEHCVLSKTMHGSGTVTFEYASGDSERLNPHMEIKVGGYSQAVPAGGSGSFEMQFAHNDVFELKQHGSVMLINNLKVTC